MSFFTQQYKVKKTTCNFAGSLSIFQQIFKCLFIPLIFYVQGWYSQIVSGQQL